jgi:UDP-N-acetyl-D-mannosaminuronate dehydrogenase
MGKSYKSGVPETKGSPGLALVDVLTTKGYIVETYDPKFDEALPATDHETIIVTIAEPAFKNLKAIAHKSKVVLDYAGVVDKSSLPDRVRFWQSGKGWVNSLDIETGRIT